MKRTPNQAKAVCGICPAGCRAVVICRPGEHSAEIVCFPARMRSPLMRTGPGAAAIRMGRGVGAPCYVFCAMIAPHADMFSDIVQAGLVAVWGSNPATESPASDLKRILRIPGLVKDRSGPTVMMNADLRHDPISGLLICKSLPCGVKKAKNLYASVRPVEPRAMELRAVRPASAQGPRRIYLDHNATTAPDPAVCDAMSEAMRSRFGNPSSIHFEGRASRTAIETARRKTAKLLGCAARRIVFTGGGSEAINLALKGAAFRFKGRKGTIITSMIEHPSVLGACRWLERADCRVKLLPVDAYGMVSPDDLREALDEDTFLVSIMAANNETGTLQRVAELAAAAHAGGALFHTDAVQAAGKVPVDVQSLDVDLLSLSAHKFHGPKGVGALYVRDDALIEPLVHGGGQEHELRAGTENIAGIVGLGLAAEFAEKRLPVMASRVKGLRDRLQQGIMDMVPGAAVNGPLEDRLPNTLSISLPGIRGESMVIALDAWGVSLSSGSACRSKHGPPSPALLAMGLSAEQAHCTLRFSLGIGNTSEEIDLTLALIERTIRESMSAVSFASCR